MIRRLSILLAWLCLSGQAAALDFQAIGKVAATPERLSGEFHQIKYLSTLDTEIDSSGHFQYERNQQIRWLTEQPIQSETTITPDSLSMQQDGQEVMRLGGDSQPAVRILSHILFSVLTADWQALAQYFSIDGTVDGTNWDVTLTPKTDDLKSVVTHIDLDGARYLQHIELHEASGDRIRIRFDKLQP
ncbi:outer membrane lipoprotein carrier protein LolA [Marinobacter mangrovi]|uniref:outer membrane lipoprotein carrier protein LolA n=1 Tax=Marinobacter mangrovi TaxID=2803918 RepID=UPI0019322BB6|nr:outer membrane lipoprotein carrier protein LolA [Marinobacter mangrovi]